jgi:hypothetical protein
MEDSLALAGMERWPEQKNSILSREIASTILALRVPLRE